MHSCSHFVVGAQFDKWQLSQGMHKVVMDENGDENSKKRDTDANVLAELGRDGDNDAPISPTSCSVPSFPSFAGTTTQPIASTTFSSTRTQSRVAPLQPLNNDSIDEECCRSTSIDGSADALEENVTEIGQPEVTEEQQLRNGPTVTFTSPPRNASIVGARSPSGATLLKAPTLQSLKTQVWICMNMCTHTTLCIVHVSLCMTAHLSVLFIP